jgi:hypothetical protein
MLVIYLVYDSQLDDEKESVRPERKREKNNSSDARRLYLKYSTEYPFSKIARRKIRKISSSCLLSLLLSCLASPAANKEA